MSPTLISFLAFVFTIVQQPIGNPFFVSILPNEVTQYRRIQTDCIAGPSNNVALLADEYQVGVQVRELKTNDMITLTFPDHIEQFRVTDIQRYMAFDPYEVSREAMFRNLETNETITSLDLGEQIFCSEPYHLAIQTCFDNAYGRFFVLAVPVGLKPNRGLARR